MNRHLQNLVTLISSLVILAFIVYGVIWVLIAREMTRNLDDIWNNQERYRIVIAGNEPAITGFPAPPTITFSGSVTDRNGLIYASPAFIYRGFPLPTQAITLEAPQGIDFSGPVLRTPVHLDMLKLRVRIPAGFPTKFDATTIRAWQQQGGTLPVEDLEVLRGSLKLDGSGYLNLDEKLQPSGMLTVKLTGIDDLLNELVANKTIGEKQALMAQSLLNLMSQKDTATGETSITTGIRIQSGGVFLGPLRVASLPEWRWTN